MTRPVTGSEPVPSLLSLPRVHFLYLPQLPEFIRKLPFLVSAPFKIAQQVLSVLLALLWGIRHPPEFILAQVSFAHHFCAWVVLEKSAKNPPSIPTLILVWLVGTLRGSKVIIDWHNLGYSILALKLGSGHIFVRLAKMSILPSLPYADHQTKPANRFEARFGRVAYAHLFVTRAMHDFLAKEWNLKYDTYVVPLLDGILNVFERGHKAVLYDRPPAHFHPATAFETHEVTRPCSVILPFTFTSSALPSHFPIPACCLSAGVQSTDIHASYPSDVPRAPKSAV